MSEIWLGLGSNLGAKRSNILRALDLAGGPCRLDRVSSLYKTEPVGFKDQDWFLNCAAHGVTELPPRELLHALKAIERQMGRAERVRNGPRVIDLDILLYGNQVIEEDGLVIPHPRMHERLFVLQPLREIAPKLAHPVMGKTMEELAASLPNAERVEIEEPLSLFGDEHGKPGRGQGGPSRA
jgi:2-amino-4-hydroxy-6-hydroxymethyldihydropteridine diphosphokinase